MLIVGRGEAKITNVCPTFSSDGSMLAYGERTDSDTALVVLDIDPVGSVSESTRIDLGPGGAAPCPPCWSHDGSRLSYLSEEPPGPATVVVRGIGRLHSRRRRWRSDRHRAESHHAYIRSSRGRHVGPIP